MNLVFVNSFEKRTEEDRMVSAQVSIAEQHGVWHVLWNEPDQDGRGTQSSWYQGDMWQEMLTVFRTKLAEKAADGFLPLIEGSFDSSHSQSSKSLFTQMLQFYSESNANDDLFQKLKQWRKEQAIKEGKPSYLIAYNRVLLMLACFTPQSTQELMQIPGFGEQKCSLYGQAIIQITSAFPRSGVYPLDWVVQEVDEYAFRLWQHKQKELKVKAHLERQTAKKKLLELIASGQSLEAVAQSLQLPRRELVLWIEELDAEGYDFEAWIDVELQGMSDEDRELAWHAMKEEGDKYLKPIVKKMYNEEQLKGRDLDQVYEWLRLLRLRFRREHTAEVKAG
jgi:hypothetical protein